MQRSDWLVVGNQQFIPTTGVSQSALAPCYYSHSVQNSFTDSGHNLLEIPRMKTGFAQRSFTYSAPHVWNTLPREITGNLNVTANTFKKKLKTFYYTTSYT